MPVDEPTVTNPADPALLQTPVPTDVADKVSVEPVQTDEAPVMVPATGSGTTVIVLVAIAVPQLLLTA